MEKEGRGCRAAWTYGLVACLLAGPVAAAETTVTELPGWRSGESSYSTMIYAVQGSRVVYHTDATLVPEDTHEGTDAYLYDLESGELALSFPPGCVPITISTAVDQSVSFMALSRDGTRAIARENTDAGRSPGDLGDGLIAYDFNTGCYTLASRTTAGIPMPYVGQEKISGNGHYVFFSSRDYSTDPVDYRFYRHDLETGETIEVLARYDGSSLGDTYVNLEAVSYDGSRMLVRTSEGDALVFGTDAVYFLVDVPAGTVTPLKFALEGGSALSVTSITPTDDFTHLLLRLHGGSSSGGTLPTSLYGEGFVVEYYAVYDVALGETKTLLDFLAPPPALSRIYQPSTAGSYFATWGPDSRYMIMSTGALQVPGDIHDRQETVYVYDRETRQAWISGLGADGELLHTVLVPITETGSSYGPSPLGDGSAVLSWNIPRNTGRESGTLIASRPQPANIAVELATAGERATMTVRNLGTEPVLNVGVAVVGASEPSIGFDASATQCYGRSMFAGESRKDCTIGMLAAGASIELPVYVESGGGVTAYVAPLSDPDADTSDNTATTTLPEKPDDNAGEGTDNDNVDDGSASDGTESGGGAVAALFPWLLCGVALHSRRRRKDER